MMAGRRSVAATMSHFQALWNSALIHQHHNHRSKPSSYSHSIAHLLIRKHKGLLQTYAMSGPQVHRRQQRPTLEATFIALFAIILLTTQHAVDAFSLSMVATGSFGTRRLRVPSPSVAPSGVTSSLISTLAEAALKRRLRAQTGVACDVTANSSDMLFKGKVGPVTVKGRGWQSPLGLTCRALEATVDTCELDIGRVLSSQKLVLTTPARGNAMVALNSVDFGNFITHPLIKPPGLVNGSEAGFEFSKGGASIDAKKGTVTFSGRYEGETYKCTLSRGNDVQKALVTVQSQSAELQSTSQELTLVISKFFNEMVFELDGTFLTFRDMMVTGKGGEPSVMFALHITVKKFPSPGLAF